MRGSKHGKATELHEEKANVLNYNYSCYNKEPNILPYRPEHNIMIGQVAKHQDNIIKGIQ